MRILYQNTTLQSIHFYLLFFIFFSMQLFAEPLAGTQLQLTENEKQWLAEHPIIKVGIDPDYAYYESVYEDGKKISIVTEYLHRLESILGVHFEITNDEPWVELMRMIKNDELDMLTSIVKTPERAEYLAFSEPYSDTPIIIIDNGNGTFIGSLKQLANKKVSVEKGYFMEELMKNNYPKIIRVTAPNTQEALEMVASGEVDAYVGDANVANFIIKNQNLTTLRFSGQTEYISSQCFALTKPNELLALILTKAMATIPKDESDAMFNRWLHIEQGIKSETLIKYTSAIALLFLVIGYWIYRLKREVNYRKNAEAKLKASETLYRDLIENMVDVIWKTDENLHFTYISPSVEQTIGFKPQELIGHHIFELFTNEGIATATERIRQREEDAKRGLHENYSKLEIQHKSKNGLFIWGEVVSKPEFDKNKNIVGYRGISRDITERKEMQDKIHELAFYDPLTKLANRRLLHDRLKITIASSKRSQKHSAILYLDLDNFKPLNDTYGHSAGDLLLVEVAQRLQGCVREVDTVARIGGDEFVVILNELSEEKEKSIEEAKNVAEKIRSALSRRYSLNLESDTTSHIEHYCTTSIGVLVFLANDESEEDLLQYADTAMYEAKDGGRNTIRFYDKNCQAR